MFIKNVKDVEEIIAGDGSFLKEILHPLKDIVDINYSIALAKVKPKQTTLKHKLKASSEVYFMLKGKGRMYIDNETRIVGEGDIIYIPPSSIQRIENVGEEELIFLCIVSPPWRKEDEEIIQGDEIPSQ